MARIDYSCEAVSVEGFIQQLAVGYLKNHYRYYVMGFLRSAKDPREIDRKLIETYRIDIDKWERHRRKRASLANLQYLRHERTFLLLATGPERTHPFFEREVEIRDAREVPIKYAGYEISYRDGRVWVRIERAIYNRLKAYFAEIATKRRVVDLVKEFRELPFEPYRPVRYQLFRILDEVNRIRKRAGNRGMVPQTAIRQKRRICRPFAPLRADEGQTAAGDSAYLEAAPR
jgi:hypothetical protein